MLESDGKGRIVRTRRHIETKVHTEALVGSDWKAVAQTEILKLRMMVEGYRLQLEDEACGDDLLDASRALKAALSKLETDEGEGLGDLGL